MNAGMTIKQIIEDRITPVPIAGCWLWTGALSNGYGSFRTKDRLYAAHKASYEAFVGPVPPGSWVLHSCDVRACCNPDHLFTGSRQDNIRDAQVKGRLKCPGRKRKKGLVYKRPLRHLDTLIHEMRVGGASVSKIARDMGVNRRTVQRALKVPL
jgi:hypothetical protein